MAAKADYQTKFESYRGKTLFEQLPAAEQRLIKSLAFDFRLTFQEFRQLTEASRDLTMWGEGGLAGWPGSDQQPRLTAAKDAFLKGISDRMTELRRSPKNYRLRPERKSLLRMHKQVLPRSSDKKIYGLCPVASEKTVCCNLRTIDVVENCVFGCSYCTIQTFYTRDIRIEQRIAGKLDRIELDPDRFYHFGTGQSSDSLAWGNREGILDAHFRFAWQHPNMLMEFKTKSNNIRHFLENAVPPNVVCSWSLNPEAVIEQEEHFTASLAQRLDAARALADRGIKVSFHFHPMIYFEGWEEAYTGIADLIRQRFEPDEILFISYGSVTLIKPVIRKIRNLGNPTKILQMELVPDPHGKLTYPDAIKIRMFRAIHEKFTGWHDRVFFYLCMEKADIWQSSFGYTYPSNELFEQDFGRRTMYKLRDHQ